MATPSKNISRERDNRVGVDEDGSLRSLKDNVAMPEDANSSRSVEPNWGIKRHRTSRIEIIRETDVPLPKTVNTDASVSSKKLILGSQSLKGGDQPISAKSYSLRSVKNNVVMPEDANVTGSVEPKWGNKKNVRTSIGLETDVPLKTVNTDAAGSGKKPLSTSQAVELIQSSTVDLLKQSKGKTLTCKPTGEKVKAVQTVTADLGYVLIINEVAAELELIANSLRNKADMAEDIEEEVSTLTNALSKLKFLMGNKK